MRFLLYLQHGLSWIFLPVIVPIYFIFLRSWGYKIRNVTKIRKACIEEFKKHPGPWLVCANHLTMIDSMILIYGMMSLPNHFAHFRFIPWNLPERKNFQKKNIFLAVLCFLAKCIPVNRCGDRKEMRTSLEKCNVLLGRGQSLMIFPEGGRTRTGRVDTEGFSYGVGRFVKEFPDLKVMCLYLRGDHQETYGTFPRSGERFTMKMEVLQLERVEFTGLRAQRFYAEQIISKLAGMEETYFAVHRKRYRKPVRSRRLGQEQEYALSEARLHVE